MSEISEILKKITPITLNEMGGVALMNRIDRKFCFNTNKLNEIITNISPFYTILEIEQQRISRYKTLYYDTENYSLYQMHQNGKLNRYKVRHRSYVESDLGFLEVKFKNNQGRTIKSRIKIKEVPEIWSENLASFIISRTPYDAQNLFPVIWINYNRLTLVSKNSDERLTIDLNLEFIKDEITLNFDTLVIAEVKQDRKNNSEFANMMRQMHIKEGFISKYAMGISMTCEVKKNNFKHKLKTISKITNDSNHIVTSH